MRGGRKAESAGPSPGRAAAERSRTPLQAEGGGNLIVHRLPRSSRRDEGRGAEFGEFMQTLGRAEGFGDLANSDARRSGFASSTAMGVGFVKLTSTWMPARGPRPATARTSR